MVTNLSDLMRSYPVKENHIGSAVSEILQYKENDRHHVTLLLLRIVTKKNVIYK